MEQSRTSQVNFTLLHLQSHSETSAQANKSPSWTIGLKLAVPRSRRAQSNWLCTADFSKMISEELKSLWTKKTKMEME